MLIASLLERADVCLKCYCVIMSEEYAAACEHCGATAHMPLLDFQSIRGVKGAECVVVRRLYALRGFS